VSVTPSPLLNYIAKLNEETARLTEAINNAKIGNAYGIYNGFYIAGQAIPPSGITKIGQDVIKATTAECTNNVPSGTKLFIYNPSTMTCSYYSSPQAISLSSLQVDPNTSISTQNRTIGSTSL